MEKQHHDPDNRQYNRQSVGLGPGAQVTFLEAQLAASFETQEALCARVQELEAQVETLQKENHRLQRHAGTAPGHGGWRRRLRWW